MERGIRIFSGDTYILASDLLAFEATCPAVLDTVGHAVSWVTSDNFPNFLFLSFCHKKNLCIVVSIVYYYYSGLEKSLRRINLKNNSLEVPIQFISIFC